MISFFSIYVKGQMLKDRRKSDVTNQMLKDRRQLNNGRRDKSSSGS